MEDFRDLKTDGGGGGRSSISIFLKEIYGKGLLRWNGNATGFIQLGESNDLTFRRGNGKFYIENFDIFGKGEEWSYLLKWKG